MDSHFARPQPIALAACHADGPSRGPASGRADSVRGTGPATGSISHLAVVTLMGVHSIPYFMVRR